MQPSTPMPEHDAKHQKILDELRRSDTVEGFEPDEQLVCIIHKHPFGIIPQYIASFVGMAAAFGMVYYLIPQLVESDQLAAAQSIAAVVLIVAMSLTVLGLIVATYVYQRCQLIISDKHVTQIIQKSLFSREVSELSMSNVEDVAVSKSGIISTIFDYGRLRIQTAGALDNFLFTYCPNPNHYGKVILGARQRYAESLREDQNRPPILYPAAQQQLQTPQPPQAPQPPVTPQS